MLNPPNRRGTDPYARWCGRGGTARCPPIPIDRASTVLPLPWRERTSSVSRTGLRFYLIIGGRSSPSSGESDANRDRGETNQRQPSRRTPRAIAPNRSNRGGCRSLRSPQIPNSGRRRTGVPVSSGRYRRRRKTIPNQLVMNRFRDEMVDLVRISATDA